MTEDELRAVFRATVTTTVPPPPMASSAALTAGRRARRRRHITWLGAGTGTAAVLTAGALALGNLTGGGAPLEVGAPAPAGSPPALTTAPVPEKSGWGTYPSGSPMTDATAYEGPEHDRAIRLLDELLKIVPAGFDAPAGPALGTHGQPARTAQASLISEQGAPHRWQYLASAAVARDGKTGRVAVEVHPVTSGNTGEGCALTQYIWGVSGGRCHDVMVGPVKVGVTAAPTDSSSLQWAAFRQANGTVVFLGQSASLGFWPEGELAPLPAPPLTEQQLAELAVDPRFDVTR
ncbi:hypothetical protein Drose_21570 [Dactylosporangium roseum]|uniref:Uncharacterized protein n=1 Tax=Dactylosporangium roseum TaxID=47989 RepID=A0ABY5YVT2_9ACTN|nr:hypothetical protein [Dactylosporangium roseum]UWZ33861.1 hypothetical protein Drose_21570 [Dactylosporangium roseum]